MRFFLSVSTVLILVCLFNACTKDEVETTGGISGFVTSSSNGEPLSRVSVMLNPGGETATTGDDGRYEFGDLEPDIYTIQVQCDGYKTNTKRISVVAGGIAVGDMQMEVGEDNFALSTRELVFSPSNTSNVITLTNTSLSMPISWKVTECPSWLSVSPSSNLSLGKGKSDEMVVTLGSNPQAQGYIIIQAAGTTVSVYVTFSTTGDHEGGGNGDGDSGVSGTVVSCDSRIAVKMTSFRMSGSTAILEYTLQNSGEDIANFRIQQYKCEVHDNLGTGYDTGYTTKVYYELGSKKVFDGWSTISQSFPNGTTLKGIIKIMNVPSGTGEFSRIAVGVTNYASSWSLDDDQVLFKNVKIKR